MANSNMVGGANGVTVEKEGKDFFVSFAEFSETMVKRMRYLVREDESVKFNADEGKWFVPNSLKDKLEAAVEGMRDFFGNEGVAVSVADNGDHYIEFDYSKQKAQIAGGIAGAQFDKDMKAWRVPANSAALVVKEGFSSYFEKAIHDLRVMNREIRSNFEGIKKVAVDYAANQNMKPGLVFEHIDSSRSGKILDANANFAVQITGKEKGVVYLAVHNQDNLNKIAFKRDDLYISYDDKGKGSVRTMEVFKGQQEEREKMRQFADSKMSGAKVLNASFKDGSSYEGTVMKVGKHFVLQNTGRNTFTLHNLDKLEQKVVEGGNLSIAYKNGAGKVADKDVKKHTEIDR